MVETVICPLLKKHLYKVTEHHQNLCIPLAKTRVSAQSCQSSRHLIVTSPQLHSSAM